MATQHKTPGVYVEEISTLAPSVVGVATAIPAFVGFTAKQPAKNPNDPVKISNLLEYESIFGYGPTLSVAQKSSTLLNAGYVMYDSIRLFYENGGGVCYILSAGTMGTAVTADVYKKEIAMLEKYSEVTLLACPDAALLLTSDDDLASVQQTMLNHCGTMKNRFAILDVKDDNVSTFRYKIGVNNLCYGAAYFPMLKSSYTAEIAYPSVINYMESCNDRYSVSEEAKSLAAIEVSALEKAVQDAKDALAKAKEKDKAAKEKELNDATTALVEHEFKVKCSKANLAGYDEALKELQDIACNITPSAAVIGAIAATDSSAGVWQAPANISLTSIKNVSVNLTNTQQEDLNVHETGKSINAIRVFSGKGIIIWGARTLDGNDNEWRYISVRRLFNYIEESTQKSTSWAVFQPNDANTWIKIKCQISNFLTSLWRDGALAGATPEDAFYVNVGLGTTMDANDILNGNLIVQIGIAAVRPAEFIELKFSHKVQQ